jgi:hypothetical protein
MRLQEACPHSYVIPHGIFMYCLLCHQLMPAELDFTRKYVEAIMPPRIFDITEPLWNKIRPWERIPFSLVTKYAWYISVINSLEYLVMPIFRMGKPMFFSARKISEKTGLKYSYPQDAKKLHWLSDDNLTSPIVICEGVADAAYVSLIHNSIALLGNFYDGSLDEQLKGNDVLIALDGDSVGVYSAMEIYKHLAPLANVKVIVFPDEKEPPDYEVEELRGILDG